MLFRARESEVVMNRKLLQRVLAYSAVYIGWGTTYLAIRVGLRDLSPAAYLSVRFLLAALALTGLLAARPARLKSAIGGLSARSIFHSALQGFLLLVAGLLFTVYSEITLPSSVTAIVVGCAPVGFAVFDRLLNAVKIKSSTVFALVLGISGVILLAHGGHASPQGSVDLRGLLFVIFGTNMWCFGSVFSRRLKPVSYPLINVWIQYVSSGVILAAIAFLVEGFHFSAIAHVGQATLISLLYISLVPSLISYTSYLWLLGNEPSARVSTYAFVNPVVALIAGVLILGESAAPSVLGALALVLAGTATQFGLFTFRIYIPRRRSKSHAS